MSERKAYQYPPRIIIGKSQSRLAEGQCDACSPAVPLFNSSSGEMNGEWYKSLPLMAPILVNPDHYLVHSEVLKNIYLLSESALAFLRQFDQPKPLTYIPEWWSQEWDVGCAHSFTEKLVDLGLIVPEGLEVPEMVEAPEMLTTWIHITDRCNLRCAYCYLPHVREDMPLDIGIAAIEATFRSAKSHGFRKIKFKYAGGEPLLCFSTVTQLHNHAISLAEQDGVELEGVVLSNGSLLTGQTVRTILYLGLTLMISMDGLGESHNSQRPYAGGRGSADDVAEAVEIALDMGLQPDISITVSGRTAAGLADLVSWLLERDLPFSFNFYRENDYSASQADLRLDEEKIIQGMLAAFRVIEARLPRRNLLASLADRANLGTAHLRTCGVGHNYLVFDQKGQASKCQMQMTHPITDVNSADPLHFIKLDQVGVQNISVEEKEGCRDCQWKYWCAGGCPLATYRATGRYDIKSPNCNIYKALYPEILRLEGLRILLYETDPEH